MITRYIKEYRSKTSISIHPSSTSPHHANLFINARHYAHLYLPSRQNTTQLPYSAGSLFQQSYIEPQLSPPTPAMSPAKRSRKPRKVLQESYPTHDSPGPSSYTLSQPRVSNANVSPVLGNTLDGPMPLTYAQVAAAGHAAPVVTRGQKIAVTQVQAASSTHDRTERQLQPTGKLTLKLSAKASNGNPLARRTVAESLMALSPPANAALAAPVEENREATGLMPSRNHKSPKQHHSMLKTPYYLDGRLKGTPPQDERYNSPILEEAAMTSNFGQKITKPGRPMSPTFNKVYRLRIDEMWRSQPSPTSSGRNNARLALPANETATDPQKASQTAGTKLVPHSGQDPKDLESALCDVSPSQRVLSTSPKSAAIARSSPSTERKLDMAPSMSLVSLLAQPGSENEAEALASGEDGFDYVDAPVSDLGEMEKEMNGRRRRGWFAGRR
jgi:hypothetical protein